MDIVIDLPLSVVPVVRRPPLSLPRRAGEMDESEDRAPGMPLLGFVIAIALSAPLWALIGFTAWALLT